MWAPSRIVCGSPALQIVGRAAALACELNLHQRVPLLVCVCAGPFVQSALLVAELAIIVGLCTPAGLALVAASNRTV